MEFVKTIFNGLYICKPKIWEDDRGFFYESYNRKTFDQIMPGIEFVQDNQAQSTRGVLRGLHYQVRDHAQAKLVSVLHGEVLDVAVDLRKSEQTYGKVFSMRLDAKQRTQLFIPRGFAHGYLTLSQTAIFFYKCDNFYSKAHEAGIKYDDLNLNINWEMDPGSFIISPKDAVLPAFGEHKM